MDGGGGGKRVGQGRWFPRVANCWCPIVLGEQASDQQNDSLVIDLRLLRQIKRMRKACREWGGVRPSAIMYHSTASLHWTLHVMIWVRSVWSLYYVKIILSFIYISIGYCMAAIIHRPWDPHACARVCGCGCVCMYGYVCVDCGWWMRGEEPAEWWNDEVGDGCVLQPRPATDDDDDEVY